MGISPQAGREARAVLISDIHYNLKNLALAELALTQAIDKAAEVCLPLIVAGDLHDEKAILRGECVNALIQTFQYAKAQGVNVIVIPGNHCRINEKSYQHSLNFLRPYCELIDSPRYLPIRNLWLIPYEHDIDALRTTLAGIPKGSTVICHQGLQGAWMGDYVQDKTSLRPDDFADLRVISGHYHRAQDIKCGKTGLFSYCGSPFTHSYGEANDGPKGFRVLYSDGSLESIPTNLRAHVVQELTIDEYEKGISYAKRDINWFKVRGPASRLVGVKRYPGSDYKLDLIPTDDVLAQVDTNKLTHAEILDTLIDSMSETEKQKADLKLMWRNVIETF